MKNNIKKAKQAQREGEQKKPVQAAAEADGKVRGRGRGGRGRGRGQKTKKGAPKNDYDMEDIQDKETACSLEDDLEALEKATDIYEVGLSGQPLRRRLFHDEVDAGGPSATPVRKGRGHGRGGGDLGRGPCKDVPVPCKPLEAVCIEDDAVPDVKSKGRVAAKAKKAKATPSAPSTSLEAEPPRKRQRRVSRTSTSTTGTIAPDEGEAAQHEKLYAPFMARACEGLAAGTQGLTFMGLKDHVRANRIDTFKKVQLVVYWSRCAVGLRLMTDPAKPQILYVQFKTSQANELDYNYSLLTAYAAVHHVASRSS